MAGFDSTTAISDLRAYLRDYEWLNNLVEDGTENSDDDLDRAIRFGLMHFNLVPPISGYTVDNLPDDAYYFIIIEATIQILISVGILHSRNRLNYSNGGLTVADHDKAGPYQSWIQILRNLQQLYELESKYKKAANINALYAGTGISSEFLCFTHSSWRIFY